MKGLVFLALAACGGKQAATTPNADGPTIASVAELGILMKNDINPAFSRLTFLVFHGGSVEEDPEALKVELGRSASLLRDSIAKLRAWTNVPTHTQQGRDVFFTYAESVDKMAERLVAAVAKDERSVAEAQLDQIADTCNNCHHFFRLKIEDSVVPSKSAATPPPQAAMNFFGIGDDR